MDMRKLLSRLGEKMVAGFLDDSENFRNWAVLGLNDKHFERLNLCAELGHDLSCPILSREAWSSFSETFIQQPAATLFNSVPLPNVWVDLGCHYGFFSLAIEKKRREAGHKAGSSRALLVDGDPRVLHAVQKVIELNELAPGMQILHRAVGDGDSVTFFERTGMGSSLSAFPRAAGKPVVVPTLKDEDVTSFFPSGIDMMKIDIEGAETVCFHKHQVLLKCTRFLVIEWHSWAEGEKGGHESVRKGCERNGFHHIATLEEARHLLIDGKKFECGTEVFVRK